MSIIIKTEEAFDKTVSYMGICGSGMLVIIAYNLIGCIFRGLGDSRTPLVTVAIACVCNIAGDLLLCAVCCVQNGNERRTDRTAGSAGGRVLFDHSGNRKRTGCSPRSSYVILDSITKSA